MLGTSIAKIHAYPLKPRGFEEPLFPTAQSKRALIEHLLEAPWLTRASELERRTGESAHALREPVELKCSRGQVELVWLQSGRRCFWGKRWIVEVLDRWREVGWWWDENRHRDRLIFRVLLSGGAVVDVARERTGGWFLVGVVD